MILNLSENVFGCLKFALPNLEKTKLLEQGLTISVIGIGVVFMGLIFLFFFMKLFVYLLTLSTSKNKTDHPTLNIIGRTKTAPISEEIAAAISMAIQRSREEFHDMEKTIITFNRIAKPYSPWSSKIYSIRQYNR